jgi:RNA recognition motif-containing protein
MSVRLYIGNLSKDLQRQDFESVFADYGDDLVSVKLISDKKTGKCRGFGFVTVKTDEKADEIVAKFNGHMLEDSPLKVEKALPRSKSTTEDRPEAGSNNSNNKRGKGGKKSSSGSSSGDGTAQPDPRWAGELEKLKQMLAAQTTSS